MYINPKRIDCPDCGHFAHHKNACGGGMGDYCDCPYESTESAMTQRFCGINISDKKMSFERCWKPAVNYIEGFDPLGNKTYKMWMCAEHYDNWVGTHD